jgi:hypothetical protein
MTESVEFLLILLIMIMSYIYDLGYQEIPILPYECKCQCNKIYDIYGDHPFNCPKNHKGRPHNMITNKLSQALAQLLTIANIISPTTNLDKEINLHLPADPTAHCTSL